MNKEDLKLYAIGAVIIAAGIVIVLGAILELKASFRMRVYAISHDCNWTYVGVDNSDDGYVCK